MFDLAEMYRTNLHNYIQELRGNLRVFCRVKPLSGEKKPTISYPEKKQLVDEIINHHSDGDQKITSLCLKSLEIGNSPQKKAIFYFDRVFDDACTQEDVK